VESSNDQEIFHFLHGLDKHYNQNSISDIGPVTVDHDLQSGLMSQFLKQGKGGSLAQALWALFDRPWFSRAWVIQEVVLATRAKVICGKQSCSWKSLGHLVKYIRNNNLLSWVGDDRGIRSIGTMSILSNAIIDYKVHPPMIKLLSMTRHFESTIPHDKVFALLGLASKATKASIIVDYRISSTDIFTRVARSMMLEHNAIFEVLCHAGFHPDNPRTDLPSWVPDWAFSSKASQTSSIHFGQFKVATSRVAEVSVFTSCNLITISGWIFDSIMSLSSTSLKPQTRTEFLHTSERADNPSLLWEDHFVQWQSNLLKELYEFCQPFQPYPTGQDWLVAFSRTLVCNAALSSFVDNIDETDESIVQGYTAMMEMIEMGLRVSTNEAGLSDDEIERMGIIADDGRKYEGNLRPAAGRKLCISNKGYFGWVPGASSPGDIVCIFKGAEVPYVLRPRPGGHFILIGDCYVQGIMDGEAMHIDLTQRKFNIR
jgi:hypothetical protein